MKAPYQKRQYTFEAEIILGNPQMTCDRFGICKIIEAKNIKLYQRTFQCAAAICHYQPTKKTLTIDFWQKSLSKATQKYYFSSSGFLIEKNCTPTFFLKQDSILPTSLTLAEGLYPIDFDSEDFFSISLEVIEEKQFSLGLPSFAFVSDGSN
jgi:hypothetical protein